MQCQTVTLQKYVLTTSERKNVFYIFANLISALLYKLLFSFFIKKK